MNKYEIRFCGVRRSGNHAVILWLAYHFREPVYFYNNVMPGENPLDRALDRLPRRGPRNAKAVDQGDPEARECLLYNYESIRLCDVRGGTLRSFVPEPDAMLGASERQFDVMVLRDPFNLAASWWRHHENKRVPPQKRLDGVRHGVLERWKAYAAETLGTTDHLPRKVVVLFNDWAASEDYRRGISSEMGLEFCDDGRDRVMDIGHGSSFDGTTYDGRAREMKVLERWKRFAADAHFRSLFKDDMIWVLSGEIFGSIPGTEALRGRGGL